MRKYLTGAPTAIIVGFLYPLPGLMHIQSVHLNKFRRFSDLTITDVPHSARLVVIAGPNGSGKSSVFDGFRTWQLFVGGVGGLNDPLYHFKQGVGAQEWPNLVQVTFHEALDDARKKKAFYIRSAYRNDADFTLSQLASVGSALAPPRINRLIDNDASVGDNYRRLVSQSVEGIFSGGYDQMNVRDLREGFIGTVRESMKRVFGDLVLVGVGDPLSNGSFFFEKGISKNFHYKNLSGGEKAAFDLLLDLIVQLRYYDDTVFCIDEPETHLNTRLQGKLLEEFLNLVPATCQLWIATHSIGMMRKARDLHEQRPGEVVFLDFEDQDFDAPITVRPAAVNRRFWNRVLGVALDDLAKLVAPKQVVLCEGKPLSSKQAKAEFDARCYRVIFAADRPDTDFVSVGNSSDVMADRLEIGKAIQTIVAGTKIVRLIDRDDRSPEEIADAQAVGVRVLSRRHIESYLADDEILAALCIVNDNPAAVAAVLAAKQAAIAASVQRGNPPDDMKSAVGELYGAIRRILQIVGSGNTVDAFLRDTLAPLVTPNTNTYCQMRLDIFGF